MAIVAPAQVLADDPPQLARRSGFEAEGGGEDDIIAVVQDAVVVSEPEVVQIDAPALSLLGENLGGFHDLLEEDRPIPFRSEEVEVLPHGPADCARDPDEVVESPKSPPYRRLDEIREAVHSGARANAHVVEKIDAPHLGADHHSAEAAVPYENVRAPAQQEVRNAEFPCRHDGVRQLVGGARPHEQVRCPADLEGRHGTERHVALDPARPEAPFEFATEFRRIHASPGGREGRVPAQR